MISELFQPIKDVFIVITDVLEPLRDVLIVLIMFIFTIVSLPFAIIQILWKNSKIQLFFIVKKYNTVERLENSIRRLKNLQGTKYSHHERILKWLIPTLEKKLDKIKNV